jgi:peptidoglycan/LPS O-acetylase OafA/YrhL
VNGSGGTHTAVYGTSLLDHLARIYVDLKLATMTDTQRLSELATSRFSVPAADALKLKARPAPSLHVEERNSRPKYRSDIDGLRAVSILAVVGYHVFPKWVPGGFVGVDVFFVISGFLISTIIFGSLAERSFSFIEFYAHRIRRIFPALIAVMVFCFAVGWDVLLPAEFEYLGKHIAASAAFVQNLLLSRESGYFDIASELKPLNHLWSLAIEEQFYAVFPLLVWGAWRLGFNLLGLVAAICGISFALNIFGISHNPTATFFSLSTRAWELMAGGLLAGLMLDKASPQLRLTGGWGERAKSALFDRSRILWPGRAAAGPTIKWLASIAGFALIMYAVFAFHSSMPYPGKMALVPVLGAVLLIASGASAGVNRFVLSNRLGVFIGVISYPLYLWHWPLLSYLTIIDNAPPSLSERVIAAALSMILAWGTYRFIERPVRQGKRSRKAVAGGLVFAVVMLMVAGLNGQSLYRDYDVQTTKIVQYWNFTGYPDAPGSSFDEAHQWLTIGHNEKNRILFVGDSHAEQYVNTIAKSLAATRSNQSEDVAEVLFPPFANFPPTLSAELLSDDSISTLVLSHFWALQYGSAKVNNAIRCCGNGLNDTIGTESDDGAAAVEQLKESNRQDSPRMDEFDRRLTDLAKTWRNAGKKVYFVLDNPFGEELAPQFLVKRSLFHRIEIVLRPLTRQQMIRRDEPMRSRIMEIAAESDSEIIDPIQYLCNQNFCPALFPDGMPIYKDYDHLSDYSVINHVHYFDFLFMPGATRPRGLSASSPDTSTGTIRSSAPDSQER